MRDSKSNFQNVIRDYLDQLAEIDAEFAEKYRVHYCPVKNGNWSLK